MLCDQLRRLFQFWYFTFENVNFLLKLFFFILNFSNFDRSISFDLNFLPTQVFNQFVPLCLERSHDYFNFCYFPAVFLTFCSHGFEFIFFVYHLHQLFKTIKGDEFSNDFFQFFVFELYPTTSILIPHMMKSFCFFLQDEDIFFQFVVFFQQ